MSKRFLIILIVFVVPLTGCPLWPVKEVDLDRECVYNKAREYESELPFDKPLFYSELDSYEYNGIEMEGFYFLGESEGAKTAFETPGSPINETFLVSDKYNILSYVEIEKEEMDEITSLGDERLSDEEYLYNRIERSIMNNLFYEYYEEYFDELNSFLEESNVVSFWDIEQMTCGRDASLSSIPLSHPSMNEYIHMSLSYELNMNQKEIIINAIKNDNLSVDTNSELRLLVEEMVKEDKLNIAKIQLTLAGEVSSRGEPFEYELQYENGGEEGFNRDFLNIIGIINMNFKTEGLEREDAVSGFRTWIYYIEYMNGVQTRSANSSR